MTAKRYETEEAVGQGGMGVVLRATDLVLQREVAYKHIHKKFAARPGVIERFVQEARITARLDHPNIVPVYSLEPTADGTPAYAMKLVVGRTLEDLLDDAMEAARKGRVPEELSLVSRVEVFLKVCDAVHYAHSNGILHRDLKPTNIMLGAYHEVYVMDWGLAKEIGADEAATLDAEIDSEAETRVLQTREGKIKGTPEYMSPEQAYGRNAQLDARSDQFSLGLILREVITLAPAVRAPDAREVILRIRECSLEPMRPPPGFKLAADLAAIAERATEAQPNDRYPDVEALADDLRRWMQGEPTHARPDNSWRAAVRTLGRHRDKALMALVTLGLAFVVVVTGSALLVSLQQQAAQAREQRLADVLSEVSRQASTADGELLRLQGLLRGLANVAEYSLQHADPAETVYFDHDFGLATTSPPDVGPAKGHSGSVSFRHPVIRMAPGVDPAPLRDRLGRLALLAPDFRRVLLASRGETAASLGTEVGIATLVQQGAPVVGAYVALEEGVHVSFPGHGGYSDDYDPRLRPWYALGQSARGPTWGSPHEDANGQGLLLVCATPLRDAEQRFIGVAGLEITFDTVVDTLMEGARLRGVGTTWLLDGQGRVVVRSDQPKAATQGEPPVFHVPAVASAVQRGHGGNRITDGSLFAWAELESIGWWLVVSGDVGRVRAD